MGFRNKSGNTYLAILLFTVGMPVMAQDKVGQVLEDSDTGFVIRNDKTPADIGFPENVLLNDVLGVKGRGDELMISFEAAYNTSGAARSCKPTADRPRHSGGPIAERSRPRWTAEVRIHPRKSG